MSTTTTLTAASQCVESYVGDVQEEQITRNILASWQVQRSMHSEVKKVLEVAKRKKRNERVVRLVDAAARGDVAEVSHIAPLCQIVFCDCHSCRLPSCHAVLMPSTWP